MFHFLTSAVRVRKNLALIICLYFTGSSASGLIPSPVSPSFQNHLDQIMTVLHSSITEA